MTCATFNQGHIECNLLKSRVHVSMACKILTKMRKRYTVSCVISLYTLSENLLVPNAVREHMVMTYQRVWRYTWLGIHNETCEIHGHCYEHKIWLYKWWIDPGGSWRGRGWNGARIWVPCMSTQTSNYLSWSPDLYNSIQMCAHTYKIQPNTTLKLKILSVSFVTISKLETVTPRPWTTGL